MLIKGLIEKYESLTYTEHTRYELSIFEDSYLIEEVEFIFSQELKVDNVAPANARKIIKTFNLLFACIVCFILSYACLPWGWAALLNGETSGTGMDSHGPALVKPMIGIAALVMGFQFIVNIINHLKEDKKDR